MPGDYSYLYKHTEGFKRHAESSMETITDVIQWGRDKGLKDPKAQLNKVIEEVGEIAHEAKGEGLASQGSCHPRFR